MTRWHAAHPSERISAAVHGRESGLAWHMLTEEQKKPWEVEAARHKASSQQARREWQKRKRQQPQPPQPAVKEENGGLPQWAEADARGRKEEQEEMATPNQVSGEDGELSPALSTRSVPRVKEEDGEDEAVEEAKVQQPPPALGPRLYTRAALLAPMDIVAATAFRLFQQLTVYSLQQEAVEQGRRLTQTAAQQVSCSRRHRSSQPLPLVHVLATACSLTTPAPLPLPSLLL